MTASRRQGPPLTLDEARQIFDYNPETGDLIWKVTRLSYRGCVVPGAIAGTNSHGYIAVTVNQRFYRAHRIVWLLMTGEWPPKTMDLDHINGDRSDNRWCNLRLATRSQNNWNKPVQANNPHGVSGVYQRTYRTGNTKWHARVYVDRKPILLGHFDTMEEAVAARKAAEIKYFGEFRHAA